MGQEPQIKFMRKCALSGSCWETVKYPILTACKLGMKEMREQIGHLQIFIMF